MNQELIDASPILRKVRNIIPSIHIDCMLQLIGRHNVNTITYIVISRYIDNHEKDISDYTSDDIDEIIYYIIQEWRIHAIRCFSNIACIN